MKSCRRRDGPTVYSMVLAAKGFDMSSRTRAVRFEPVKFLWITLQLVCHRYERATHLALREALEYRRDMDASISHTRTKTRQVPGSEFDEFVTGSGRGCCQPSLPSL